MNITETDRELLELAAKAAGQERSAAGDPWSNARGQLWAPLTDDGDALRLAVKLRFRLECMTLQTAASTFDRKISKPVDHTADQEHDLWPFERCPYAATRRAIVCAAAEIGRQMP